MSAPARATGRPTIAFFGATGGCTANAAAQSLKAGFSATALARTPNKLLTLLCDTHNVPESTIQSNLTIVQGSVSDHDAIRRVLCPPSGPVDLIIFGIGGSPKFQANLFKPITIDNAKVCEEGTTAILTAIRDLTQEGRFNGYQKPVMVVISTTGVSKQNDVPLPMKPLYHFILAVPHEDKKKMEDLVIAGSQGPDAALSSFIIVKPTLLMDGPAKGLQHVRVGWVWPDGKEDQSPGPQLGYGVKRADVGNWIFENAVKGRREDWCGKLVTLTH